MGNGAWPSGEPNKTGIGWRDDFSCRTWSSLPFTEGQEGSYVWTWSFRKLGPKSLLQIACHDSLNQWLPTLFSPWPSWGELGGPAACGWIFPQHTHTPLPLLFWWGVRGRKSLVQSGGDMCACTAARLSETLWALQPYAITPLGGWGPLA